MRAFVVLALALPIVSWADVHPKLVGRPWELNDAYETMKAQGWQFRSTFGLPERLCYAAPPGKNWPGGDWGSDAVRKQAVADGIIKYGPRTDDGRCHAEDAVR